MSNKENKNYNIKQSLPYLLIGILIIIFVIFSNNSNLNNTNLYNRCHLIAYSLSNENDNEKNLITGTRYFNTSGMTSFENKVKRYIESNQNNHVLYRVTPIFEGDNLLASGVQIEAKSVEDNGKEVCFNVYVYNVQPGVEIDYSTGDFIEK